jgi:hypothetical protein
VMIWLKLGGNLLDLVEISLLSTRRESGP